MATTYIVTGVDTGIPSLPNDSVLTGLKVGDTFTTTLDSGVEAELIAAGLIAKSPLSSPVVMQSDGTLAAKDGRSFSGGSGVPVGGTGLTGATAATRYAGGTASGAPVSGTFAVGDFVVGETGKIWVCTVAGSPGTWANVGASAGVSSFNSRTGVVAPTSGDYTAAQVTNAADKSSGSQQAFTGEVKAPDFTAGGLTGATAASRYAGATASGAPASGTFAVGDFVIDQSGAVWICTVAGTPGTWAKGGPVSSVFGRTGAVVATSGDYTAAQVTNAADKASGSQQNFTGEVKSPDIVAGGLTGATAASRYVGATASGAPASGTFAVGDWISDQTGKRWTCTVAGSPGTWVQEPGTASGTPQYLSHTGKYVASLGGAPNAGSGNPGVGFMVAVPFPVPSAFTAVALGLDITSAAATAVVRLGIYADDGTMQPGALLVDGGTIDGSTTGYKEVTISQALAAGVVWLVGVQQTAAASYMCSQNAVPLPSDSTHVLSGKVFGYGNNGGTSGALPGTFGAVAFYQNTATGNSAAPHILVKAA